MEIPDILNDKPQKNTKSGGEIDYSGVPDILSNAKPAPKEALKPAPQPTAPTFPQYDTAIKSKPQLTTWGKIKQYAGDKATALFKIGTPSAGSSALGSVPIVKDIAWGSLQDIYSGVKNGEFKDLAAKGDYAGNAIIKGFADFAGEIGDKLGEVGDTINAAAIAGGRYLGQKAGAKLGTRSQETNTFGELYNYEKEKYGKSLIATGINKITDRIASDAGTAKDAAAARQTRDSNVIKELSKKDAFDRVVDVPKNYLKKLQEENTQKYLAEKEARGEKPDLDLVDQIAIATPNLLTFILGGGAVRGGITKLGVKEATAAAVSSAVNVLWESGMEADQTKEILLSQGKTEEEASIGAVTNFAQNMALIGITNKLDGFFEKNTYTGFKRLYSYAGKAGGEALQEGLQQVSQNYNTDRPLMEGVGENALIGGIMGLGGTVIFDVIAYGGHKNMSMEEIDSVIRKDPRIPEDKKEIVKKIATGQITEQEKEELLKEAVKDTTKNNAFIAEADDTGEAHTALISDVETAIQSGSRLSAISSAIQDQYGVSKEYSEKVVSQALANIQSMSEVVDKATKQTADEKVKLNIPDIENRPIEQKVEKIKPAEPTKTEKAKAETKTKQAIKANSGGTLKIARLGENRNVEYVDVSVLGTGQIAGHDVFVHIGDYGQYGVSERSTGYSVGQSRYKTPSRAIADIEAQLVAKAGSLEALSEQIIKGKESKQEINKTEKKSKKVYNKDNDRKNISKSNRSKSKGVSEPVSTSQEQQGEIGKTPDGSSESVIQDGDTDNDTTSKRDVSNGDGSSIVEQVSEDAINPQDIEEDWQNHFSDEYTQLGADIYSLEQQLKEAPKAEIDNIQKKIDSLTEKQAEIENDFIEKHNNKKVSNDDIEAAVENAITVNENGEIVLNEKDNTDIVDLVKNFKSGGKTKKGRGVLDEYYTDKQIVNAIFNFLDISNNSTILEPSVGVGNFIPSNGKTEAYEINKTTAGIAKILNPKATIFNKSFETTFIDERGNKKSFSPKYDLIIGNPPYGDHRGLYKGLGEEEHISKYEEYFTKRGLDVLKDGGHLVFVLPSSFLNTESNKAKQAIRDAGGVLVSAFRLPNGVFEGTDIGTDIVIIKKGTKEEAKANYKHLIENTYFQANFDHILGTLEWRKNRFGEQEGYVAGDIENALSRLNELNIEKIAIGVAEKAKIEPTSDNLAGIEETIDDSSTNAVEGIIEATEKENKEAEAKQKAKDEAKQKRLNEKIKKVAKVSNAEKINLGEQQDLNMSENEFNHWLNREKDGSIKSSFTHDPAITSYYKGKWYLDFTYLSGNIYEKLDQLEKDRSELEPSQYLKQKAALEAVKPEPLPLERIKMNANSNFLKDFKVSREIKNWQGENTGEWEERSLSEDFLKFADDLPFKALGGLTLYDLRGYVRNEAVRGGDKDQNARIRKMRVLVANELLEKYLGEIKQNEPELAAKIEAEYNKQFNAIHIPDYSNVPLSITINNSLNGKPFQLTSVQTQAIGRLIEKGVGILAHDVGFGKTLTAILATQQSIEYGNTKKPLFIVPKATYEQWVNTILEVIPNAKINNLYNLGNQYKGDLSKIKINEGEYNIITEEGFKSIGFKDETYKSYAEQYAYATDDLSADFSSKSERERQKEQTSKEENVGKMQRGTKNGLYFEDLGFDHIIVDEVHNANNIITKIKMPEGKATEFRSISKPAKPSLYGIKTWVASQYIQDMNDGKNVYLLSATPFTNSPMQYFSVLSLLANKTMKDMGVNNVNDFLNQFMDIEVRLEYKPNGTFSERQVIRNFKNFNLLRKLLNEYIDFKSGEENPDLIRPEKQQRINNFSKSQDYITNATKIQEEFGGSKDTLKLIGQLRALSISSSLLKDGEIDIKNYKEIVEKSPKLYAIAKTIGSNQRANKTAGREATEIVYSPFGVEIFPILKEYLIKEEKMNPKEIAIITGATSADKRAQIQEEFNKEGGEIKILMGTDTIGTGLNLQKRTSDIHFLGLPYNFTDLTQVEGRAWRQGNKWKNVRMNHYLMENSYDALHFQILTSKQKRYELAIKNNEDSIDVGDVDVEKQLADLITDPQLIAEIRLKEKEKQFAEELRLKNSELSFAEKKIDKIVEKERELDRAEENKIRYEKYLEEEKGKSPNNEYMIKHYSNYIADYKKDIVNLKKDIVKIKDQYIAAGIDMTALMAKIDPLKAEVKSLQTRISDLNTPETKVAYLNEAKKSIKKIEPFELDDVKQVLNSYQSEAENIYTLEDRKSGVVNTKIETQKVEVENVKENVKKENKNKKIKKIVKKEIKVPEELAIINDSSLSVEEKVNTLLDKKQENKEYKDVGERVAGSKKENAVIKAIYKYGDQSMFDEIVKRLGWESVLDVVNKSEILEQTGFSDMVKNDYDNKVPFQIAKYKKQFIDGLYQKPQLAGKKRGKYSYSHYLYKITKDADGELDTNSAKEEDIAEVAKIYPTLLKNIVNEVISIKDTNGSKITSNYGDVYFDNLGNILLEKENASYEISLDAIGRFSGLHRGSFSYSIREAGNEFEPERYKELLEPEKREAVEIDRTHSNFETIENYDIGDNEVKRERVKAETLTSDFGFKSVQLGNYMDDQSAYEHIQQTIGALERMSVALDMDLSKLINKKGLSIAYGARGGGGALAHYEPSKNIINLTKKRGDGSFGHEFMHFIDFTANTSAGKKLSSIYTEGSSRYYSEDAIARNLMKAILNGDYQIEKTFTPNDEPLDKFIPNEYGRWEDGEYKNFPLDLPKVIDYIKEEYAKDSSIVGKGIRIRENGEFSITNWYSADFKIAPQLVANILGKEFTAKLQNNEGSIFKKNALKNQAKNNPNSYWVKNEELLARAFQAYLQDKMTEAGVYTEYATRNTIAESDESHLNNYFPQGQERKAINEKFDDFFKYYRNKGEYFSAEHTERAAEIRKEIENIRKQLDTLYEEERIIRNEVRGRLGVDNSQEYYDKVKPTQEKRAVLIEEQSKWQNELYKLTGSAYKYDQGKINKGLTVSGEFLKEASERLKIKFDYQFFDTILGQMGQAAYGVNKGNAIALRTDAPFTTEHHELVHLTLKNLQKIDALKHLNRDEILMEQAIKMNLPIELYNTKEVEEQLALDFEDYVLGIDKKPTGKIHQLFIWLKEQLGKFLELLTGKKYFIDQYFDILQSGFSVSEKYVELSDGHEFENYISGKTLDLSDFEKSNEMSLSEEHIKYKEQLKDAEGEVNNLIDLMKSNKETMETLAHFTNITSESEIVLKAQEEVSNYVNAVLEIENIKKDISDASSKFMKMVAQREAIEDLQKALEAKIEVVFVKTRNTSKKVKVAVDPEILLEVAKSEETEIENEINNTDYTGYTENNEKVKKDIGKRSVSKFLMNKVAGLEMEADYEIQHTVNQMAIAQEIIEKNPTKLKAILEGKFPVPNQVAETVFYDALSKYYLSKNNARLYKMSLAKMAEAATRGGQNSAFMQGIYKTYDETSPEVYINQIKQIREEISDTDFKLHNPFASKETKKIKRAEKQAVKKEKAAAIKKSYNEIMAIKQERLEKILDSFMC